MQLIPEVEVSVLASDGGSRRVPVGECISIGRAEECDIPLPDQILSRRHAEIQRRDDGHYIVDLESTNGTFLNGLRVTERRLCDGDTISLGENRIIFHQRDTRRNVYGQNATLARQVSDSSVESTSGKTINLTNLAQENRTLGVLTRATSAVLGPVSIPELLEKMLDLAFEVIPAERGAILFLEGSPAKPVVRATRSRREHDTVRQLSQSIVDRVVNDRMALLLRDVREDPTLSARQSIVSQSIVSVICAPLWLATEGNPAGSVLGVVYFDSQAKNRAFSELDLQTLTILANIIATKVESARLFEELLAKRRLAQDMRLAAEIQASLLPASGPQVDGFDIAGGTRPCRTVGGDYYDFIFQDGSVSLTLGDVSGKGVGAAMLMVALRTAVRAHWLEGSLPEATRSINRTFFENVPEGQFATLFLARVDTKSGRLAYVNAGHNRPLLVRADGEVDLLGSGGGTIVGAFEGVSFTEGEVTIRPGDILLVFSDGVSETWPDPDLADRKLADLVRRTARLGAEAIKDEIFRELDRQCNHLKDDQTVIVLRRQRAIM